MKLVIYWSGVDIAFVKIERSKGTKIVYVKHHKTWWTTHRNYLKNFFHHISLNTKIYFQILISGEVIIFGTNAIRTFAPIILFKKNVKVVFNEVPRNKFPITLLDRLIMWRIPTFVSSEARKKYFQETYKCNAGILQNVPFLSYPEINIRADNKRAVYMGLLTNQRFSKFEQKSLLNFLNEHNFTLDVYGRKIGDFEFLSHNKVKFFKEVPNEDVANILKNYSFGIVSYFRENINNELCAPLKTFDYISAGLKVISINRNVGMNDLALKYPALFYILGDDFNRDNSQYLEQRSQYLDNAINSNKDFSS